MRVVETHDLTDVELCDAIAIGQAKRLVADIGRDPFDAAARERIKTDVDKSTFRD
jgi:hypothetical protein